MRTVTDVLEELQYLTLELQGEFVCEQISYSQYQQDLKTLAASYIDELREIHECETEIKALFAEYAEKIIDLIGRYR